MDGTFKVGVFSPNDPRPWVRSENLDMMLEYEGHLVSALRERGVEVVRGGEGLPREDQVAWSSALVKDHAARLAEARPAVLIVNQGSWTFPYDSIDAVKLFGELTGDAPRVVIWSYKDTRVPGLVAGMAAGGGLKRLGIPYATCYGRIDEDPAAADRLMEVLEFYRGRWESGEAVSRALELLPFQKYLALGGMSLKMATTTADVDQWQKLFKVSYEALDQSILPDRAAAMVDWTSQPGASDYEILDDRVAEAVTFLVDGGNGAFDFAGERTTSLEKFVLQIAFYYAAIDIAREYDVTFMGIKCQDELSARFCTVCPAAAFLNNDVGPDGRVKQIVPVACENDMDSALTQLLLHLLTKKPSGFGDFRDVEDGVLAIVNCGQHPHYFYGTADEPGMLKLGRAEYLGQESFYAAGGCSVRGRTPGGQTVTIARLGRQNLRYQLVATVMETVDVDVAEHDLYSRSWPIMKGRVPVTDDVLIDAWPCNHLAFAFGDWTAALAELAHRLDIGFRIFDKTGREFFKPT